MRGALAVAAGLVLAACHAEPPSPRKADEGPALLRAVYRNADGTMVLIVPEKGQRGAPVGDCAAPLLIDSRTGQARVLDDVEVQARLRKMQLAGATRGACPRN